jgi:hypothetical protein
MWNQYLSPFLCILLRGVDGEFNERLLHRQCFLFDPSPWNDVIERAWVVYLMMMSNHSIYIDEAESVQGTSCESTEFDTMWAYMPAIDHTFGPVATEEVGGRSRRRMLSAFFDLVTHVLGRHGAIDWAKLNLFHIHRKVLCERNIS